MVSSEKDLMTYTPTLKITLPKPSTQDLDRETANDPNIWFAKMFPESAAHHGPAFLQATYNDIDGLKHFLPVELNIDFFAHALGGDQRMAHRTVYYAPEETWYFFDPRIDCFCPTTESKLEALLSSYLIRCAQESGSLVEVRRIVTEFRRPDILQSVIRRSKALLRADRSFFEGEKGNKRMVDTRIIDPNEAPVYVQFVKQNIIQQPQAKLTVADAFHWYFKFCRELGQNPLTRAEFRELVTEVIREEFRIGMRHDVMDERGKQQHGWLGIGYRRELADAGQN